LIRDLSDINQDTVISLLTSPFFTQNKNTYQPPTFRKGKLDPPAYDQLDLPLQLVLVKSPNVFKTERIFSRKIYYKLHTPAPHSIVHLRGIYQQDQLHLYTKETNVQLYVVIQFDYLEAQFLLRNIGPHCIDTWAPRTTNHQIIIINYSVQLYRNSLERSLALLYTEFLLKKNTSRTMNTMTATVAEASQVKTITQEQWNRTNGLVVLLVMNWNPLWILVLRSGEIMASL
jgi:hypothetical protein